MTGETEPGGEPLHEGFPPVKIATLLSLQRKTGRKVTAHAQNILTQRVGHQRGKVNLHQLVDVIHAAATKPATRGAGHYALYFTLKGRAERVHAARDENPSVPSRTDHEPLHSGHAVTRSSFGEPHVTGNPFRYFIKRKE